jgi:hypothetical protein
MTVPTSVEFLNRFPEFGELSLSVIDRCLAEAGRVTESSVWRTTHTEAVSYLTAHILSTRVMQVGLQVGAQSGQPLGTGPDASLYGQEYERLKGTLPISGFAL